MQRVVVTATNWQGDQEEAAYWLPAPERHALDDLATHLFDIEAWLRPAAWSEPRARQYVSGSYLLWSDRAGEAAPPEIAAASVAGTAWPFEGRIEQFGDAVGQAQCGYLDSGQALETLRLMREAGVIAYGYGGVDPPELSLGTFGSGNFTTNAGWFSFWLTPRSPDGYPGCPD